MPLCSLKNQKVVPPSPSAQSLNVLASPVTNITLHGDSGFVFYPAGLRLLPLDHLEWVDARVMLIIMTYNKNTVGLYWINVYIYYIHIYIHRALTQIISFANTRSLVRYLGDVDLPPVMHWCRLAYGNVSKPVMDDYTNVVSKNSFKCFILTCVDAGLHCTCLGY